MRFLSSLCLIATALLFPICRAQASRLTRLQEVDAFLAPGNVSQMEYSSETGLLFLRNSGSVIRVVDTSTRQQTSWRLANGTFTDMDISPDGQYLYAADFGGECPSLVPSYVQRYSLSAGTWESATAPGVAYRLSAVDSSRFLLLSSDQGVEITLNRWGPAITQLSMSSSYLYEGDIDFSFSTARVLHAGTMSLHDVTAFTIVGDSLVTQESSSKHLTNNKGGSAVLSTDQRRFYYGIAQYDSANVTNAQLLFPETVLAASADLAFGAAGYYDVLTGTKLGNLPFTPSAFALDDDGTELWTMDPKAGLLHHYMIVPEPTVASMICLSALLLLSSPLHTRSRGRRTGTASLGPPQLAGASHRTSTKRGGLSVSVRPPILAILVALCLNGERAEYTQALILTENTELASATTRASLPVPSLSGNPTDNERTPRIELRSGRTLRVPSDYPTIQQGIDAAADGDVVLLDKGTYQGPGNRALDTLGKTVTLRGAAHHESIVDCQYLGPAFSFNTDGAGSLPLIEGLTIRRAQQRSSSGGIELGNTDTAFRDCVIEDGCGFLIAASRLTLTGCVLRHNSPYALSCSNSDIVIRDCLFDGNIEAIGTGGGSLFAGSLSITGSAFVGNASGVSWRGPLKAVNCRFGSTNGMALYAFLRSDDTAQIANCWFRSNTGTALCIRGGTATVMNCAMSRNSATSGGGLYICDGASVLLLNSILWQNTASVTGPQIAISNTSATTLTISHCDVQGGLAAVSKPRTATLNWGEGNIDEDPRFLDPEGPDYLAGTADDNLRLGSGSPCLDAGDMAVLTDLTTDFDNGPRLVGPNVDLGPYEQAVLLPVTGTLVIPEGGTASVDITLATEPSESVAVVVAPCAATSDPDITVASGGTLVFTPTGGEHPWNIPQTTTLAAATDTDRVNGTATIEIRGPGNSRSEIAAREADSTPPPAVFVNQFAPSGGDGSSWATAFTSLQDALAYAERSDRRTPLDVWVATGIYHPDQGERVYRNDRYTAFRLLNNVAIYGGFTGTENTRDERDPAANATILSGDLLDDDGGGYSNLAENSDVVVMADQVDGTAVLDGFTITGGYGFHGAGLFVNSASPRFVNCTVSGNVATYGGGVHQGGTAHLHALPADQQPGELHRRRHLS